MKNDFLDFYGEKNISPVRQDISDNIVHYKRREKLYRQLGIPVIAFNNSNIIEVGPGGGFNTLAFFKWNAAFIDLIEANTKGIEDMEYLFNDKMVNNNSYKIHKSIIEEYITEKKYDFVIAESFIQFLSNQKPVIDKLKSLVVEGGVVVITCSDEVCLFLEQIKRMVGHTIVKNIENYDDKVKHLVKIFEPQLKNLRGVSRPAADWVQDQLINPVAINGNTLSLIEAIQLFGDEFDVLGSSPNLFVDYSWYKDIWFDYKSSYYDQFEKKNGNLLLANMDEKFLEIEENVFLKRKISNIKRCASQYESTFDINIINEICNDIADLKHLFMKMDNKLYIISEEIIAMLKAIQECKDINFEFYPNMFSAFGRTQQYLSMVKKRN